MASGALRKMALQDKNLLKYECLLFDLDDTLYPRSSGIEAAVGKNIGDYMVEKLGVETSKMAELRHVIYNHYGTTGAGLKSIGYDIDFDDFHRFIHGRLPYELIKPDPALRKLLLSLPIRRVIFTNADKIHAAIALSKLGLEDCFEKVICFETLNPTRKNSVLDDKANMEYARSTLDSAITSGPKNGHFEIFDIVGSLSQPGLNSVFPEPIVVCKPSENAIEQALKIANADAQKTMFFDDSVRNIQAGKRVGLHTVLVGKSQKIEGADFAVESIHDIREAIPELWEGIDIKSKSS